MLAVFNTSGAWAWARNLSETPWPLLPVANRPLLDYWMETCAEQGIRSVQIILGEGAEQIERFAGDGERWNVKIQYTFVRPHEDGITYLKSICSHLTDGLLYIGGPFFLRRRQAFRPEGFQSLETCRYDLGGATLFLFSRNKEGLTDLLGGGAGSTRGLEQVHIHPYAIGDIASYFDLNMKMVVAEFSRYTTAGFSGGDGSSLGYNVHTPPSSNLKSPILVGNDCRFGAMTSVGPNAVIGNHVIVDAFSDVENCLILDDTYIGCNLEIRNKIVAGNRLIDPADGTTVEIDDSWLVAQNRPAMRTEDLFRYFLLWFVALALVAILLLPFCVLGLILLVRGIAHFSNETFHDPRTGYIDLPVFHKLKNCKSVVYRLFRAFSLERFPWLLQVLRGKLFLCGQPPMRHPDDDDVIKQLTHYYPGVFCYQDYNKDSDRLVDSLWYAHARSLFEDVKILIKALVTRFLHAGH